MNSILRLPVRAYDYLYDGYGWFGLAAAGVGAVVLFVAILVWFDRRR